MTRELVNLLESYLRREIGVEAINDWIAVNIWDAPEDTADLIDQISVELTYITNGVSDEEHLRKRFAEILAPFKVSP